MDKYAITGMSCAACVSRVEKAVNKVDGVTECSVNLLTNSMMVKGTASAEEIVKAVTNAGYGASPILSANSAKASKATENTDSLEDKESPVLLKRFLWSLGFLLILMYFSMGYSMWNFPLPSFFDSNLIAIALVQLIFAAIILLINKKFFISGFKSLSHAAPNMDTLVSLGSGVSFLWSIYCLFAMTSASVKNDFTAMHSYFHNLYFESSAMILTLITFGKFLEAKSKGKTTNALKGLMKLTPKTAVLIRDGNEVTVSIDDVKIDDIFVVRPGQTIPVDAVVIEGSSSVDEAALTGESIPANKEIDSKVFGGTLNQSGFLKCRATAVGQDTTINQIIQLVSDASSSKAPIAKLADKVSGIFVPTVICISIITFIVWMIVGADFAFTLERAISVLVISCPCALGLATPVAIMVASGKGASNGILYKTAESLEVTGKAKVIALDKTGTITKGQPSVTHIVQEGQTSKEELIQIALNIESQSEHPLSKAITDYALKNSYKAQSVSDFKAISGKGVKAIFDGHVICGGNKKFILENSSDNSNTNNLNTNNLSNLEDFAKHGETPLYFSKDGKLLGTIFVADTIKDDSIQAIKELHKKGFEVIMLTGDNELTANAIARQVGVDKVYAGILPQDKATVIKSLQTDEHGKKQTVIMVGDGINDAPSLTVADCGIAMGKGTDIALDAADVVLVNGTLTDAVNAITLSKKTLTNIKQNLFWAFIYNSIGIPLAAGCFIAPFNWTLKPMFGAAAMALSSFCVVTNALRLNFVKLSKGKNNSTEVPNKDKASTEEKSSTNNGTQNQGANKMTKTLKIKGMMCSHCEAHVKEALEKLSAIDSALTDHQKGTAIIQLNAEVSEDDLKKAVTDAGYEYEGILS